MKELIDILPQIIIYIVLGYSFIRTYKFVRIVEQNKETEGVLTSSLAVGFALNCFFELAPTTGNNLMDKVIMIISSPILGYFAGTIVNSDKFGVICRFFKIKQTPNSTIWRDIEDSHCGVFIRLENYENKTVFDGLYVLGEAYERFPIIQLSGYRKAVDGEIEFDYKDKPYNTIVLDTSKFDEISVFYDTRSPKIKEWYK